MENSAEREILVVQRYLVKCQAQGIIIFDEECFDITTEEPIHIPLQLLKLWNPSTFS